MKLLLIIFMSCLFACEPANYDKSIEGKLELNPRSGYNYLELVDFESGEIFLVKEGEVQIKIDYGFFYWDSDHIFKIYQNGSYLGAFKVPKDSFEDDKSFTYLMLDSRLGYNMLGGNIKKILELERWVEVDAYCTYTETETYSCQDSDGKSTTCTRTVTHTGDQDELHEKRKVETIYRILFDMADLVNAAVFTSDKIITNETSILNHTSCN